MKGLERVLSLFCCQLESTTQQISKVGPDEENKDKVLVLQKSETMK
jgi:hypothetical protein